MPPALNNVAVLTNQWFRFGMNPELLNLEPVNGYVSFNYLLRQQKDVFQKRNI
jgi:hypothetical protein